MLLNLKGYESIDGLPKGICFNFFETFILSGCTKLDRFPEIVGDTSHFFTSLENLNISGCSLIDQLPENIGILEKLEKLDACRTAIRKAPSSIVHLKNLKTLCFTQCSGVVGGSPSQCSSESNISFPLPKSFSGLSSLTCLSLAECNLEEAAIPEDIGCLTLLEHLELSGNNFMSLPDSISQLSNLRRFSVDNCRKLGSLPKLPLNVKHVQANDCPMLNDHMTIWPSDEGFRFIDCRNSVKAEGCLTHHPLPMPEEHIATLFPKFIKILRLCCLENPLEIESFNDFKVGFYQLCVYVPKTSFPIAGFVSGWFFHQSAGCNVVCYLPANILDDKSWIGLSLYATLKMSPSDLLKNYSDSKIAPPLLHIDLHSHGSSISHIKTLDNLPITPHSQQLFLFHIPQVYFEEHQLNRCWGISALFRTSIPNVEVERCGIQAIYEKDLENVIEMITECQLGCADNEQLCYQAYEMLVESIIDTFQFVKAKTKEQEMPIHSSYFSQREDESLQTNMFVLSANM
ncbi:hypothetical protein FEM48_Zijuj10G0168100 [Ziziphus jujuba var. spinosa]|uniref:Disease resistance protein RPS4B/Roq1-like leucine-rich repeats domain-containing protein n=1 Tax=Ziziphus jujuba var. spinosa TaxID=714518 RepID=A0A978UPJ9_ZIZJJ|nr:hypothetical protein FEM48_Zijuj10G0168100 [Ziziphus jujuba var. spinosa]